MSTKQDFKGFYKREVSGPVESVAASLDGDLAYWCEGPHYWLELQRSVSSGWHGYVGLCKPDVTLVLPKEYMV